MRNATTTLLLTLLLGYSAGSHAAGRWSGNVNMLFGGKHVTEEQFDADRHGEFGILFDITPPGWQLALAADNLGSYGEKSRTVDDPIYGLSDYTQEITTSELDIGGRKAWPAGKSVRPYLGGGVSILSLRVRQVLEPFDSDISVSDYDESGAALGLWLDAGIYWSIDHFNVGLDLRASRGEVELDGTDYQAGGNHLLLFAGYHW